ncbi:elicitor-responsive protein 3-like [Rutidosis leptorrhynchoides]|uniref:elicitor-responsive protein 3-like n=1 Tax=Rutidosis leptorrhynchoides TaxID=125765 RepID=UPI003A9959D7
MPEGTLEVLLASAKGLENTDYLSNMDPYVIITYRTQEKKSSIASGKGSSPEWNETFLFDVSSKDCTDLKIKIMDSDSGVSADDFAGHASIPLDALFRDGEIRPKSYNVMKDDKFSGEIRIGLSFTAQRSRDFDPTGGNVGGWKQSGHH